MKLKRENSYLLRAPKEGAMKVDAFVFAKEGIKVEDGAVAQLRDSASLPSIEHALGMPDIHHGYGVPIGSVAATRDVIVPAAVGYDINCGMRLMLTSLTVGEISPRELADSIARDVPLGEGKQNVRMRKSDFESVLTGGLAALASLNPGSHRVWDFFGPETQRANLDQVEDRGSMEGDLAAVPPRAIERGISQLATLGGGNHFIEIQRVGKIFDPALAERLGIFKGQLALMVHSGSRGLGHEVGGHYMKLAKQYNDKHGGGRTSQNLSFFPADSHEGRAYVSAMNAAANFAFANRALMAALVAGNLEQLYPEARPRLLYDVPHNIVKLEQHDGSLLWVHRKGSTRAFGKDRMGGTPYADVGQPVLIPGSMGTASYVLVGSDTGSKTLNSVNHGAGRVMSRTQAAGVKRRRGKGKGRQAAISDDEFKKSMEGVYLVAGNKRAVKEEAPAAYKDIDLVIETVVEAGLALPVARMEPKAVLKG